ncbi:MAG TPA: radical SAM family heme chaperone HemW [Paludibacter sp.]|nr:radical SAM family heme chaperone HemW [Paludibacter sp.]
MAGIYIHIPFCIQRCSYCDFYREIGSDSKKIDAFIQALIHEIELRKDDLNGESIQSVYFGGGTPSVLNYDQFRLIFDVLHQYFTICSNAEITLEANPDDLTEAYLDSLSPLPINRLSIGIQTFNDKHLRELNRRHNAAQAYAAIANARKYGFKNISIDLIYALPGQDMIDWEEQLDAALHLGVEHISAYGLTYEEGTPLWQHRKEGRIRETDDETAIAMFNLLRKKMKENGYETYEISNYAKPGFRSRHNSAYWKFIPYLGFGPSAHSFDGKTRQWNVSSVQQYMECIRNHQSFFEQEILSKQDFYNDYVMIALRTSEGIDINYLHERFGQELPDYCIQSAATHLAAGDLIMNGQYLSLSGTGIHIANIIIMDLIKV